MMRAILLSLVALLGTFWSVSAQHCIPSPVQSYCSPSTCSPDDFTSFCRSPAFGSSRDHFGSDWVIMFDTFDYFSLIDTSGTTLVARQFDEDSSTSAQWKRGRQSLCQNQLTTCSFAEGPQDNWIFSRHIKYPPSSTSPGGGYQTEVYIDIRFRFSRCTSNPACSNDFVTLYRQDRNTVDRQRTSQANYQLMFGPGTGNNKSRFQQTGSTDVTIVRSFVTPGDTGFHLGVHDEGTCGDIARITIYYTPCHELQDGLVYYPELVRPPEGSGPHIGQACCVDNAHPTTSLSFLAFPASDGRCERSVRCDCDPGYFLSRDGKSCNACPSGRYRSFEDKSEDGCLACPSGSKSGSAAPSCDCSTGLFRSDPSDVSLFCQPPPSSALDLTVVDCADTTVTIAFKEPIITGEGFLYIIKYSDPDNTGSFLVADNGPGSLISDGEYTLFNLTGLQPNTQYTIKVTTHNIVSGQDEANDGLRLIDVQAKTKQGVPSPPQDVTNCCKLIVWNRPAQPNGEITGFDIRIDGEKLIGKSPSDSYHRLSDADLQGTGDLIRVEVRAKTDAGEGKWSDLLPISLSDCNGGADPVTPSPVTPCPVTPCPVIPCPVTPCPVIPCPVTPSPVTPCPVTPCPVIPCPMIPCPVIPCPVIPCPATPCLVTGEIDLPGPVTNLISVDCTDTTFSVTWVNPQIRGDGFYITLEHSLPDSPGSFRAIDLPGLLSSVQGNVNFKVKNVEPDTKYTVRVITHNAVTDEAQATFHQTVSELEVTTKEGVPGVPENVQITYFSDEVVWDPPVETNGVLTGYDIRFIGDIELRNETEPSKAYYPIPDPEILGGEITIEVRARTAAGAGEWSQPLPFFNFPKLEIVAPPEIVVDLEQCPRVACPVLITIADGECPLLSAPANGQASIPSRPAGSLVNFSCDTGFTLVGNQRLTCLDDGQWNGDPPSCARDEILCPTLPTLANGRVSVDRSPATVGSRATYTCSEGYSLEGGPSLRMCEDSGSWSSSAPVCVQVICPPLPNPANGRVITTTRRVGTLALYSCDNEYVLIGAQSLTCQTDGSWSQAAPTCQQSIDPGFMLGGHSYEDGSSIKISDIGDGEGALLCVTDFTDCCSNLDPASRITRFYYPDGTEVLNSDRPLFRSRGSQVVRLNRRGDGPVPTGTYRCEIPGSNGVLQSISINIMNDAIECPELVDPDNGQVVTPTRTVGSVATFSCNVGFTLNGPEQLVRRTCQNDGQWSGTSPTCQPVLCPPLLPPANGGVDVPSRSVASRATFSCNPGYNLQGQAILVCLAREEWSSSPPTCQPVQCLSLSPPVNGGVDVPSTNVESVANFSCNVGFTLNGQEQRTCQNDGQWSGTSPSCQPVLCPLLSPPANGGVDVPSRNVDSEATFSCDPGYNLQGQATLSCLSTGEWNTAPPTCAGAPVTFELAGNSYDDGSSIRMSDIGEGEDALLCVTDFTDCCAGGAGTPKYGQFFYPDGSEVVYSASTTLYRSRGDQVVRLNRRGGGNLPIGTYRCEIPGSNGVLQSISITIMNDVIECPELVGPDNGEVVTITRSVDGVAIFLCNSGFQLTGPAARTCQSNGQWSGTSPSCQPSQIQCPSLFPPANGEVDVPSRSVESVATFSCNAGFTLNGPEQLVRRICQSNGQWSGTSPTCQPVTVTTQCPPLSPPANGGVDVPSRNVDSEATFSCDPGYKLLGQQTLVCYPTGAWSRRPPTCAGVKCANLPPPFNGKITIVNGRKANYSCILGYALTGSSNRSCLADGTWDGTAPTCSLASFSLKGKYYSNSSTVALSSIGEGEDGIIFTSDNPNCCVTPERIGECFYPDRSPTAWSSLGDEIYRSRGDQQIALNKQSGTRRQAVSGKYCCDVPNNNGGDDRHCVDIDTQN